MANYANLKAAIDTVIKANGQQEITGTVLNQTLTAMVNSLGAGYLFMGVAIPSTNPGTPDQNVFYLAGQAGTYSNFGATTLQAGLSILKWNGTWSSETLFTFDASITQNSANPITSGAVFEKLKLDGGAYDVSAHNNNQTFDSLSALLSDANLSTLIPTNIRSGGMSIKFVLTSDNKYVQFMYKLEYANTIAGNNAFVNTANWEKTNLEDEVNELCSMTSLKAEKPLFGLRLLFIDGTYLTTMNPCVKTVLYCDEVYLTYDKSDWRYGEGFCACWITDETGNTMIQGFNMDEIGFSGTIKIQRPNGMDVWYLVWPQDGTLILNPSQLSKRISILEEDSEVYYVHKQQQSGVEFNKYVNQDGGLSTISGYGSNKFEVTPGLYEFQTTMPANSSVSLWAAYKGNSLVKKGSLTSIAKKEVFDLSFYDIDTIYISWTTDTKNGAILTKIDTAITDNNPRFIEFLNNLGYAKIVDTTVSPSSTYSSKWIEDWFVKLVLGKNIFNKEWAVLGKYIDGTRLVPDENAWYCQEYIPVSPSQSYRCNVRGNYIYFYDENKNLIGSNTSYTFTTTANTAFLRITGFNQSQIGTLQIEKGSASTSYEPYHKIIPPDLLQSSVNNLLFVDLKIVDKLGTYGFTSINSAVAAVQDGGVIFVMPGEYEEAVFCRDKEVHIIGFSREKCILFNTLGDYDYAPLYQSAGSIRNMTVWSKWDSTKDYSEITHFSYAIHIDNFGTNKQYSIENCHLISDFSNTLGCGAMPNHVLTIKDCFVAHTNSYKESFPSASTGGSNCMNMHGGGNESITLINNIFISKTTDLQFGFGEGNTDVFKLLCVNNAIKTVGRLVSSHFDIQDRSYGNLNTSLNYTT